MSVKVTAWPVDDGLGDWVKEAVIGVTAPGVPYITIIIPLPPFPEVAAPNRSAPPDPPPVLFTALLLAPVDPSVPPPRPALPGEATPFCPAPAPPLANQPPGEPAYVEKFGR